MFGTYALSGTSTALSALRGARRRVCVAAPSAPATTELLDDSSPLTGKNCVLPRCEVNKTYCFFFFQVWATFRSLSRLYVGAPLVALFLLGVSPTYGPKTDCCELGKLSEKETRSPLKTCEKRKRVVRASGENERKNT